MDFLSSFSRSKNYLYIIKFFIIVSLFVGFVIPVYAIPPPETLVMLGGSIVYPGLIIIGVLTVVLKYIWVKSKIYLIWRLYLARIFCLLILVAIILKVPLSNEWRVQNHPVSLQTIQYWQQSNTKPIFIDLRYKKSYEKAHLLGALNFPFGRGLEDYLKNNPNKTIILYCELGLRSASLRWLEMDTSLLKQALNENRLYYLPGGLHKWMQLGEKAPVPVIVNIPDNYANYLLEKPNFTELKLFGDWSLSEYLKVRDTHVIPIINSNIPHDSVAEKLNSLKIPHIYFISPTKKEHYPIDNLLSVIFILFITLITLRNKELFRSLFATPSTAYKWVNALISVVVAISVIKLGLFNLTMPFDLYLYSVTTELPINMGYLLSIYTFFGLILLLHLVYPSTKRLNFIKIKLSSVFCQNPGPRPSLHPLRVLGLGPTETITPTKYIYFFKYPSWKQILIATSVVVGLYVFSYDISNIFFLSVFLLIPILVDLLLYIFVRQFRNTPKHALKILKRSGYTCEPFRKPFIQLNTQNELSIARISVLVGKKSANLGLFSGGILDEHGKNPSFLKESKIRKSELVDQVQTVRNLLLFFQQDIDLNLDNEYNIVSLNLYHNHKDSRVVARHTLLKHYQLLPNEINEKRFTSTLFQDIFANPSPLLLDILKLRWDKHGGCLKALHKLGLLIKFNDKTKEQFAAFSNQIYLDTAFEKAIFSVNKFHRIVRKKVLDLTYYLATDSIIQDYYTLILPRTQLRLLRLTELLDKPLSTRRLKRVINQEIKKLYKESAMWQSYSSMLHQHAFNQLQLEAENASSDIANLMNQPLNSLTLPSYYQLSPTNTFLDIALAEKPPNRCDYYSHAFLNTETVRTQMRQLQLKEWQLLSLLLERLREVLMLPIRLSYLNKDDFFHLPRDREKLIELLNYRCDAWEIQNQYQFPESFSLQEIEQLIPNSMEIQGELKAIRVSGNQQKITGNAVIFHESIILDQLPKTSIVIADNLLPEQIIACQHINGIILKKGGYLSHSSIIAREKNIPLIAQFQLSTIKNNDKLMIQSGNQVTVLSNKMLKWEFLEGIGPTTAIGNKAQRLAMLGQKGFNIPATIILTHSAVERINQLAYDALFKEYYEELNQLVNVLRPTKNSTIIVRSSTSAEDSSQHSYAGIFYSQANLTTTDEVVSAICAAWHNLTVQAKFIKQYSGETQVYLNLMLQSYIKGDFGGVLFTKSSMPGLMQVEIAPGGVEGVTEGSAALTSLYIDERGHAAQVIGDKKHLSNQEYHLLFHLGREIEALCGKPQDIEWIMAEQRFYIIQSRDLTLRE